MDADESSTGGDAMRAMTTVVSWTAALLLVGGMTACAAEDADDPVATERAVDPEDVGVEPMEGPGFESTRGAVCTTEKPNLRCNVFGHCRCYRTSF
jgi:hypothetical protein